MGLGAAALLIAYEMCMFTATQYAHLGLTHMDRIRMHRKAAQRCEELYNGTEPEEGS